MPTLSKTYSNRSAAMRAAREACRKALNAPRYQAAEGPDFILHPQEGEIWEWRMSKLPHKFELRGPAAEAQERTDHENTQQPAARMHI